MRLPVQDVLPAHVNSAEEFPQSIFRSNVGVEKARDGGETFPRTEAGVLDVGFIRIDMEIAECLDESAALVPVVGG